MNAMGLIGLSYRYGGNNPNQGLDCSATMQYIFKQSMRVSLPRTASEQFSVGSSVDRSSLQPGDMVFFRTAGLAAFHTWACTSVATALSMRRAWVKTSKSPALPANTGARRMQAHVESVVRAKPLHLCDKG